MVETAEPEKVLKEPPKPVYDCPICHERAVLFFRVDPDQPLREDSFVCQACGNSWQI